MRWQQEQRFNFALLCQSKNFKIALVFLAIAASAIGGVLYFHHQQMGIGEIEFFQQQTAQPSEGNITFSPSVLRSLEEARQREARLAESGNVEANTAEELGFSVTPRSSGGYLPPPDRPSGADYSSPYNRTLSEPESYYLQHNQQSLSVEALEASMTNNLLAEEHSQEQQRDAPLAEPAEPTSSTTFTPEEIKGIMRRSLVHLQETTGEEDPARIAAQLGQNPILQDLGKDLNLNQEDLQELLTELLKQQSTITPE